MGVVGGAKATLDFERLRSVLACSGLQCECQANIFENAEDFLTHETEIEKEFGV